MFLTSMIKFVWFDYKKSIFKKKKRIGIYSEKLMASMLEIGSE